MPETTPERSSRTTEPQEDTQKIEVEADLHVTVAGLPQRKPWWKSWKVRCCWIASAYPTSAGALQLLGQWQQEQELQVDTTTVWQAMLPWLLLAFNELAADMIKIYHEWKGGVRS